MWWSCRPDTNTFKKSIQLKREKTTNKQTRKTTRNLWRFENRVCSKIKVSEFSYFLNQRRRRRRRPYYLMVFIGQSFQRSTFTAMESSREETPRATGAAHIQVQQQQNYSIRNVHSIVAGVQQQQHYSHPGASVIVQNAAVLGGGNSNATLITMNNSPQQPGKYMHMYKPFVPFHSTVSISAGWKSAATTGKTWIFQVIVLSKRWGCSRPLNNASVSLFYLRFTAIFLFFFLFSNRCGPSWSIISFQKKCVDSKTVSHSHR